MDSQGSPKKIIKCVKHILVYLNRKSGIKVPCSTCMNMKFVPVTVTIVEILVKVDGAVDCVGRNVIPCAFLGKSVKHTFSCRKNYPVFPMFSFCFNVMVTSQSDIPISDLFRV